MTMKTIPIPLLFTCVCVFVGVTRAGAQNTAFTYQGHLNDNGRPANGIYDFTFQAFDAPVAGNSTGGTANIIGTAVTDGAFTALVDLGSSPFTGPARWLEIRVSTNGAGNFVTLVPRQALTPSPYAIYASTAGTVPNGAISKTHLAVNSVGTDNLENNAVNASKIAFGQVVKSLNGLTDNVSLTQGANVTINTVGNSLQISAPSGGLNLPFSGAASSPGPMFTIANFGSGPAAVFHGTVGIGTPAPTHTLHIAAGAPAIALQDTNASSQQAGFVSYRDSGNIERAWVGYGTAGSPDFSVVNARAGGNIVLLPFSGNVGVGTTVPAAKLDVRGDIRLGTGGELQAPGSEENLRVVRGVVSQSGTKVAGSGFSSSQSGTGEFAITFNPAFADIPAVSAMAQIFTGDTPIVTFTTISKSAIKIQVRNRRTGDPFNEAFLFIAMGPR